VSVYGLCVYVYVCVRMCVCISSVQPNSSSSAAEEVQGCEDTGYLILAGHFLQKSPIISGSFAKNDVQLKAFYGSSPPCNDDSRWRRACAWCL